MTPLPAAKVTGQLAPEQGTTLSDTALSWLPSAAGNLSHDIANAASVAGTTLNEALPAFAPKVPGNCSLSWAVDSAVDTAAALMLSSTAPATTSQARWPPDVSADVFASIDAREARAAASSTPKVASVAGAMLSDAAELVGPSDAGSLLSTLAREARAAESATTKVASVAGAMLNEPASVVAPSAAGSCPAMLYVFVAVLCA